MAMHTDRYNRYAILPRTWHGRMDGRRMGSHIRLPIRLTLWRYQRYHHRLLRRSTALHRHHSYLHYHILPAQTQGRQSYAQKERQLAQIENYPNTFLFVFLLFYIFFRTFAAENVE